MKGYENKENPQNNSGAKLKIVSKYFFVYGMLAYSLIMFAVFWVGVNINSVLMSFQKFFIGGEKIFAGIDNFKSFFDKLLADGDLLNTSIKNSLIIFITNFIVSMPLYILFSYLLFKKYFAHAVWKFMFMLPTIISGFVYTLVFKQFAGQPMQQLMVEIGFVNFPNLLSDVEYVFGTCIFYMIWTSFAVNLITYPNAMNAIDSAIIESAKIDGINNMYQELWYIILPLIYPTITTFVVMGIAGILSTGGPLVAFYMYSAPGRVYDFNYYYTVKVMTSTNNLSYPELAAGGFAATLVIGPLTMLVKTLMEKFSPVKDSF